MNLQAARNDTIKNEHGKKKKLLKTTLQFVSGFSVQQQLQQGTNVILVTCLFGLKTKNPVQSSAHRKSLSQEREYGRVT